MGKVTQTDEALMQAYQANGNQQELAELYLRYTPLVYGVALKYLAHAEDAQDAVMNIYQELVVKLRQHQVDNFKSWLYVLTKNHCLMQLRKRKTSPALLPEDSLMYFEDFPHLDNMAEKEAAFQQLENCLSHLPAKQKQCIELFYLQQKCYKDIALETGMEWNNIRSMIQNGRRNLKICMEQHEE